MTLGLRVSLSLIVVPIGMLATLFICYAALDPAFWVANVTWAGKAFQVGATITAIATGSSLWRRTRLARHPWFAASLLVSALVFIGFAVAAIVTGLSRF